MVGSRVHLLYGCDEMTDKSNRKVWHTAETFTYMQADKVNSILTFREHRDALLKDLADSIRQQVRELTELLDCVKSERDQQLAECQAQVKTAKREALLEAADWFESIVAGQYDGRAAGWNLRNKAKELE